MFKKSFRVFETAALIGLVAIVMATEAAETKEKPKYKIKEVMETINKGGKNSLSTKAADGKASKEEIDKIVDYYKSLPLNDPPKGDAASWKEKSEALLKAVVSLQKGETNAMVGMKAATGSCKACHTAHKAD